MHELTPTVGSRVDISIEGDEEHPGDNEQRAHMVGIVRAVVPNVELTFDTNFESNPMPAKTVWTFRLTEFGGNTLVEFFHHGYEAFEDSAADVLQDLEVVWGMEHLIALREIVEHTAKNEQ